MHAWLKAEKSSFAASRFGLRVRCVFRFIHRNVGRYFDRVHGHAEFVFRSMGYSAVGGHLWECEESCCRVWRWRGTETIWTDANVAGIAVHKDNSCGTTSHASFYSVLYFSVWYACVLLGRFASFFRRSCVCAWTWQRRNRYSHCAESLVSTNMVDVTQMHSVSFYRRRFWCGGSWPLGKLGGCWCRSTPLFPISRGDAKDMSVDDVASLSERYPCRYYLQFSIQNVGWFILARWMYAKCILFVWGLSFFLTQSFCFWIAAYRDRMLDARLG